MRAVDDIRQILAGQKFKTWAKSQVENPEDFFKREGYKGLAFCRREGLIF